ncbi:MAG: hypothetical protein ABEJ65_12540 [bacterium]
MNKTHLSSIILSLMLFLTVTPLHGFVLEEGLDNNTPDDPTDDLQGAPLWSDVNGSLRKDGKRGLGGGIEWSVESNFCEKIRPHFRDKSLDCGDFRNAIRFSLTRWGIDHPHIYFKNVSDRIDAQLPPENSSKKWKGYGAEFDIMARSPEQYEKVSGNGAYTTFWYRYSDPIGTNGEKVNGSTLTAANLVFNTDACYYLYDRNETDECNDFRALVMHEAGHAFALDHPHENPGRNFDNNTNPEDAIKIDCGDYKPGLILSKNFDSRAIMASTSIKQLMGRRRLRQDDYNARNVLYPRCNKR